MDQVKISKQTQAIPTYAPKQPSELPMFFENKPYQGASGRLYPIPYSDGLTDDKVDIDYETLVVENEYISATVLPALGGKLLRAYDKKNQEDFVYYNEVVKPALVGLAGAWISGGIEFNWPQHHRPTTYLPLEATIEENADGSKTAWTGEVEPFHRMKGMVGITVDPGRSYIKAKVRVYNRTAQPQLFMWWANLAVPVNDKYRTIFPPDCEWVNDHDRRAVLPWPVAKGVFETARPFDFGEGTDISYFDAVKVPSSYLISQGQTDMDFIAGYDGKSQSGIVALGNHHISPGKKMWTWGKGDFGDMWCSNLTDANGPYIELMTGVYTDNQPDFTWIAPYETKEFEQYWYPIHDIGDVMNATVDAAMNMQKKGNDLFFGFNATGVFNGATVSVRNKNTVVYTETVDLVPDKAYTKTIPLGDNAFEDLTVSLISAEGKVLVSYTPYKRGQKQPIEVRKPVVRPCEIETVEELYINGLHLEQYKQHNHKAEDYYNEGLRRDPGDIRCNTGLARIALRNGQFAKCVEHADVAIKRLTSRNQHPADTESLYLKGLALKYLGKNKDSYDTLYRAAWNYPHRSAAYYQLALLDCINGDYVDALEKLQLSLDLNAGHTAALNMMNVIRRKLGCADVAQQAKLQTEDDRLDLFALVEYSHHADVSEKLAQFFEKPENIIDVVTDYISAGFYEDAIYALNLVKKEYPLYHYYRAYCQAKLGQDCTAELALGDAMDSGYCFPSRIEDIAVFENAIANHDGANAYYYLGSLFFDRFDYKRAVSLFETCITKDPKHGKAYRNLALLYFDKLGDFRSARICLEKALEYRSSDPRLLLEYQQLLKNTNATIEERLAVYDKYPDLLAERDDCYLDRITLLSMQGKYKEAIETTVAKRFHIYEGGEGKLTKQYAWMHVLYGIGLANEGKAVEAQKAFLDGVNVPKSCGEAKTFFNQEAHIFYYLGQLLDSLGRHEEAVEAYEEASVYKAAISEISLFRALALQKLGRFAEAQAVLDEMEAAAEDKLINSDRRTYYGVGSPSPMPFEYDIEKMNTTDGCILKAFALLGKDKKEAAEAAITRARVQDTYDFRIYAFDQIKKTL